MSRFVIGQADSDKVLLPMGGGVQFKIEGDRAGEAVSILEHPIQPVGSRCPIPTRVVPHTHTNEDEITYVLEGP